MGIYTDREVAQRLKGDGWEEIKGQGKGSHRKFRKKGVGMTIVPKGSIYPTVYKSIAKKAGWQ